MVYITGDTHGHFDRIINFCNRMNVGTNDTIIILGDVGLNFFLNKTDEKKKKTLQALGPTFFCIHGNHEVRPQNIGTYIEGTFWNGRVLYEEKFPNIKFAIDGEIFDVPVPSGTKKAIVIGGAYSVDKYYRMFRWALLSTLLPLDDLHELESYVNGYNACQQNIEKIAKMVENDVNLQNEIAWWKDEQPSEEIKARVEASLKAVGGQIDIILSHTCPFKYEPTEAFLGGLNQDSVDSSTEQWLGQIEKNLSYDKWYCGHYHIDKKIDKIEFLFEGFDVVE